MESDSAQTNTALSLQASPCFEREYYIFLNTVNYFNIDIFCQLFNGLAYQNISPERCRIFRTLNLNISAKTNLSEKPFFQVGLIHEEEKNCHVTLPLKCVTGLFTKNYFLRFFVSIWRRVLHIIRLKTNSKNMMFLSFYIPKMFIF